VDVVPLASTSLTLPTPTSSIYQVGKWKSKPPDPPWKAQGMTHQLLSEAGVIVKCCLEAKWPNRRMWNGSR